MLLEHLPTELVLHIFPSCTSVNDVLNLAATCRRFRTIWNTSEKLPVLSGAVDAEFGPIDDAIQLVTHNESQPAHARRRVPLSMALLRQLLTVGRTARKWSDMYPIKRWKDDFQNRRLLTSSERYRLRRAIYRLWLYGKAFHNRGHPRFTRLDRSVVLARAALLHHWTTAELGEMEDVRGVMREMIENHICPSNVTIQRKFRKRFPEPDQQLMFNVHLNYPPPPTAFQQAFHATHQVTASNKYHTKYLSTVHHEPGAEGWGDEIPHYYVVEDMLKLDPGQIMWLKENAPLKQQVERYVRSLGDWFENNGDTFGQTLDWVLRERGSDLVGLQQSVAEGRLGLIDSTDHLN